MRYRVGGATSTSAASAAATVPTMMNAQMWIMVYGRTRENAITTWAGSCTPQNTAEPSMAGVKKGRPAITSTIRNQSATAAAPIRPAMNPSRRIRVNCMSSNIGSLQGGASTDPGLAPGESAVRAGLIVATFAYGAWTVTVAFMGAAGASLAHSFTVADAGMTATRAVFLFDMIQPFALATQRVAGFALGLSTCLFCWGVFDGKVLPRWLATGGLAAGAVAMALALVFREDTKADQAAFVLPVLWQVVASGAMLRGVRG